MSEAGWSLGEKEAVMHKRLVVGILAMGLGVVVAWAAVARPPELVSPAGLVELRCPTFSWSAVAGAAGYELVVYAVSGAGEVGKEPLLSARLPGGAAAWTPSGTACLATGARFAWTLRVVDSERADAWSEPALFEVAAAPSIGEVEAAIATLRRYLADSGRGGAGSGERVAEEPLEADRPAAPPRRSRTPRSEARVRSGEAGVLRPAAERDLKSATAASVPTLGTPSLTVDVNVALGAASNLFKGGSVFLWDDTTGNTAMGRLALASATGTADQNTAVGWEALRYTTSTVSYEGSYNTAVGDGALRSNTTGFSNTASGESALRSNTIGYSNTGSGASALRSNTTGHYNTASGVSALFSNTEGVANTASGFHALRSNTTGSRNTAVGYYAGSNATTGSDNIFVGSGAFGVAGDDDTIRIGGAEYQTRTFIEGIRGITTANDLPPNLGPGIMRVPAG